MPEADGRTDIYVSERYMQVSVALSLRHGKQPQNGEGWETVDGKRGDGNTSTSGDLCAFV